MDEGEINEGIIHNLHKQSQKQFCGRFLNRKKTVTWKLDLGAKYMWMEWLCCHFERDLQTKTKTIWMSICQNKMILKKILAAIWKGFLRSMRHMDFHYIAPYYKAILTRQKNTHLFAYRFKYYVENRWKWTNIHSSKECNVTYCTEQTQITCVIYQRLWIRYVENILFQNKTQMKLCHLTPNIVHTFYLNSYV